MTDFAELVETADESLFTLSTTVRGPAGKLPLTDDLLRHSPSGDLFGWSQNVGMGLNPALLGRKEFLILSTHGACAPRTARRWRWGSTAATGRSGCW